MLRLLLLGSLLLGLVACGPERSSVDDEQLTSETRRIAQEYQTSGDIARARADLQALEVANPNQWLIFVAETDIAAGADMAVTQSLAQMVSALGLQSSSVSKFLEANGAAETMASASSADSTGGPAPTSASPPSGSSTLPTVQSAATALPSEEAASAITAPIAAQTEAPAEIDIPAATPIPAPLKPSVVAGNLLNVRGGPGVGYDIVGGLQAGESAFILGKNPQGDWWQIELADGQTGWVLGALVASSNAESVAVAASIPEPPPTAIPPAPVAVAPEPVAQAPVEPPAEAPAEEPQDAASEPEPSAPAASPSDTPHFTLIERRMWNKDENGGCRGQHLLRIHVIDANGVRINGVALQGVYLGDILVTGSQGKGDGVIEWDLHGSGEDFRVIRNDDGRDATSDVSAGHTTRSVDIPKDLLIQTGYCSNSQDCDVFYDSWGCQGHHSWEAMFQRNY
ncbi:MAG: SH3 domain-containing protein [Caldilineaceae bacterium]|nr:SH3 domain-containing protein [Caldilineaceae bacterium]